MLRFFLFELSVHSKVITVRMARCGSHVQILQATLLIAAFLILSRSFCHKGLLF